MFEKALRRRTNRPWASRLIAAKIIFRKCQNTCDGKRSLLALGSDTGDGHFRVAGCGDYDFQFDLGGPSENQIAGALANTQRRVWRHPQLQYSRIHRAGTSLRRLIRDRTVIDCNSDLWNIGGAGLQFKRAGRRSCRTCRMDAGWSRKPYIYLLAPNSPALSR
jgi:hypothetical protein